MRALIERLRQQQSSEIWEQTFTIDLLTHNYSCRGALVWHEGHGKTFVWAKQTILCTGGAGRLYRETTNPDIATADGMRWPTAPGDCPRHGDDAVSIPRCCISPGDQGI